MIGFLICEHIYEPNIFILESLALMIKLNMEDGQGKRIHKVKDEPFDYAHDRWTLINLNSKS